MSGSEDPSSVPAQSQIPAPAAQCSTAASIESHCGWGCLSMTMRLTYDLDRKQWSATERRQLASGGR